MDNVTPSAIPVSQAGARVKVLEIRCPRHGDVTSEVVAHSLRGSHYTLADWTGHASVDLIRKQTQHLDCGEPLLWATEPPKETR